MFEILANFPFFRKREDLFISLFCPSLYWLDRAKRVTSFTGNKFTVAFPERYKSDHFLSNVRVGSTCEILVSVVGSDCHLEYLCQATLESLERIRVMDLRDRHLKGVLGLQYVEQLIAWFNSQNYLDEMLAVDDVVRRPLIGDDFVYLAEFRVVNSAEGPEEYGLERLELSLA